MPMTIARDFPASFANMQDIYGLAGTTPKPTSKPTPKPTSTSSSRTSDNSTRSSSSFSFSRILRKKGRSTESSSPSASASTTTLTSSRRSSVSVDSQVTLATPSVPSSASSAAKPMPASRDYEAALGTLASTYGHGGSAPTPNPSIPSATSPSSQAKPRKSGRSSPSSHGLDAQTAHLGKLMSQYGVSSGPSIGGRR